MSTWQIILAVLGVLLVVFLALSVRILKEYERGVAFRLGRLRPLLGPGLVLIMPFLDQLVRVDLRVVTLTIPPQEVITKDNVPARVNAVVLFRVVKPVESVWRSRTTPSRPRRSHRQHCARSSGGPTSTHSWRTGPI